MLEKNYTIDCPAHLTGLVDKRLRESLIKSLKLKGYKLSGEQVNLLFYVFEEDGISQKRLAEITQKSKISTVKAINLLEGNNLVVRIQSHDDLRNNNIFLTPLGKRIKEPLLDLVDEHRSSVFKGISDDEIKAFNSTLLKIMSNINS